MRANVGVFLENTIVGIKLQYEEKPIAQDWFQAFLQLESALETPEYSGRKKIVFLDELPWLDSRNSGFVSALEHFWNS